MNNGYLKFTGEFAALRSMGYKFQKLYASNYMSWCKHGIYIFKKGADITHSNVDLYKLVKFLRTSRKVRTSEMGISFFKFYTDADAKQYEYYDRTDENIERYAVNMDDWGKWEEGMPRPDYLTTILVGQGVLDTLTELHERDWYELATYE